MTLADNLTPRDTEEIKPGLFIQKTKKGYRKVEPMAWKGKLRWKEQLKTVITVRTILTLSIILFVVWSYTHDVQVYKGFYEEFTQNPIANCNEIIAFTVNPVGCTDFQSKAGLCQISGSFANLNSSLEEIKWNAG